MSLLFSSLLRFFYTNPDQFSPAQLESLSSVSLSRVLCDAADDPASLSLPADAFIRPVEGGDNAVAPCSDVTRHPRLDLELWKD